VVQRRGNERDGPPVARGRPESYQSNLRQALDTRSVVDAPDSRAAPQQAAQEPRSGPAGSFEYRVTWRRATWKPTTSTKQRVFGTLGGAYAWRAKLLEPQRRLPRRFGGHTLQLAPLTLLVLERRRVGAWEPIASGPP